MNTIKKAMIIMVALTIGAGAWGGVYLIRDSVFALDSWLLQMVVTIGAVVISCVAILFVIGILAAATEPAKKRR